MNRDLPALLGGVKVRKKPFPAHPVMGRAEINAVSRVVRSGKLSGFVASAGEPFLGGPKVRELEKLFMTYFEMPYAMAVNSATAGLHAALAACGVGPGDEVIVPPYTMSATAAAVLMANAVPRFVDIRDDVFCLDPVLIEKAITPRTRAIVVVHLFGHPAPMDEVMKVARRHHLKVIEDCAQAPGVKYQGRFAGTFGDAGVFSFNQHKTITTGEGGVVVTHEGALAEKIRLVRNHGEAVVEALGVEDIVNTLGWNYRMTELEAAVGVEQFKKLDRLTRPRRQIAAYLTKHLSRFPGITPPVTLKDSTHAYFVYALKYDSAKAGLPREILIKALQAEGIPFGMGYVKPLYLQPLYQKQICYGPGGWPFTSIPEAERPRYGRGLCPVTERMHFSELIHTPLCYYPVTLQDRADVVRAFDKIFSHRDALDQYFQQEKERRLAAYAQ